MRDEEQPDMFMSGAQLRDEGIELALSKPLTLDWKTRADAIADASVPVYGEIYYEQLRFKVEAKIGPPPNPKVDWGAWSNGLTSKKGKFIEIEQPTMKRKAYSRPKAHKRGGGQRLLRKVR